MLTTRPPCKVSLFLTGRPDLNVVGGRGGYFSQSRLASLGLGNTQGLHWL